jgi:hypothetical protein
MQTLPSRVSELLSLGEQVANSLDMEGSWPAAMPISVGEFRRILGETGQAEAAWSAAENAKADSQARLATADEEVTAWLAKARLVVMLARGENWSKQWVETGFAGRAAKIPKRIATKLALARRVVFFFSRHPEYGVSFAGVTAARGRSLYERMAVARDALELVVKDWALKRRLRNSAKRVLQRALRQIIRTLDSVLAPNDPRRLAFGLNQTPASTPEEYRHIYQPAFSEVLVHPTPIPLPLGAQTAIA